MNLPPHLQIEKLRMSLGAILDAIDYQQGNCRPNEMVGGLCPAILLQQARKAMDDTKPDTSKISPPPA